MNRVNEKVSKNDVVIDFYAPVKKDKISGDYKMILSKAKQKVLKLNLGDEFLYNYLKILLNTV